MTKDLTPEEVCKMFNTCNKHCPLWNMKIDKELDIKQTIKECIELLSTDGKGTKQQVKEKLEELIKDER